MNTATSLMLVYGKPMVALEEICEEFLNVKRYSANDLARKGELPFPAFQLREGKNQKWFVHLTDLADSIDKQRQEAKQDWANAH